MKKKMALFLTLSLLTASIAGCGGANSSKTDTSGTDSNNTDTTVADVPVEPEGELTYKENIKIGTLADLTVACRYAGTATVTTQTCNSTFNGLVTMDTEGNASPELALSWSNNEDSSEWTFVLREGVTFHDGSEFTAEDVKFTWDYASTTESDGIT